MVLVPQLAILDWFFLALISVSVTLGALKGVSRQLISWMTWISVVFISYYYCSTFASVGLMRRYVPNEMMRYAVVLLGIMLSVWVIGLSLSYLLRQSLAALHLTGMDMLLGLVFGFVQGFAIFWLLVVVLKDSVNEYPWWQNSQAVKFMVERVIPYSQKPLAALDHLHSQLDIVVLPLLLSAMESVDQVG